MTDSADFRRAQTFCYKKKLQKSIDKEYENAYNISEAVMLSV